MKTVRSKINIDRTNAKINYIQKKSSRPHLCVCTKLEQHCFASYCFKLS